MLKYIPHFILILVAAAVGFLVVNSWGEGKSPDQLAIEATAAQSAQSASLPEQDPPRSIDCSDPESLTPLDRALCEPDSGQQQYLYDPRCEGMVPLDRAKCEQSGYDSVQSAATGVGPVAPSPIFVLAPYGNLINVETNWTLTAPGAIMCRAEGAFEKDFMDMTIQPIVWPQSFPSAGEKKVTFRCDFGAGLEDATMFSVTTYVD